MVGGFIAYIKEGRPPAEVLMEAMPWLPRLRLTQILRLLEYLVPTGAEEHRSYGAGCKAGLERLFGKLKKTEVIRHIELVHEGLLLEEWSGNLPRLPGLPTTFQATEHLLCEWNKNCSKGRATFTARSGHLWKKLYDQAPGLFK